MLAVLLLLLLLLLLLHGHILKGSLHVSCRQYWHLVPHLGGRMIADTLRHVLLVLSLSCGGNSSRAFSIQQVGDVHS